MDAKVSIKTKTMPVQNLLISVDFTLVWHDIGKQEKCSSVEPPRKFFIRSWAGCQNNPIDVNFYLQKSLEFFEKKSADKI